MIKQNERFKKQVHLILQGILIRLKFLQVKKKNKEITTLNTFLGKDSEFEGNVKFINTIIIEGSFKGIIFGKGTIIVGRHGELRANIHAPNVVVYGKIYGQVSAGNKICVYSSGSIYGDITAQEFQIEKGAVIKGKCNVSFQQKINFQKLAQLN